jgi:hypothetical protein
MIDWIKGSGWPFASVGGFGFGASIMAIIMRANSLSGGDVLAFGGALLGVAVALWGTLHLEDIKAERQRTRDLKRLTDAIRRVAMARYFIPFAMGPEPLRPEISLYLRYIRLIQVYDLLVYAADRVILDDVDAWGWVKQLQKCLNDQNQFCSDRLPRLLKNEVDPADVDRWHRELSSYLNTLDTPLAALSNGASVR